MARSKKPTCSPLLVRPIVRMLRIEGNAPARAGIVVFVVAMALQLLSRVLSVDVHIHDTLFVAAADHASVMALTLLVIAVGLRAAQARDARLGSLRLGIISLLCGIIGFVGLFATLGAQGMPRRYVAYLSEFQSLQIAASLFALLLAGGALVTALAALRPRGAPRS